MTAPGGRRLPTSLWLGDRSEYETTDFDGQLRRAVVVRDVTPGSSAVPGQTFLLVRLEPPLALGGVVHSEVVIAERHAETSLLELGDRSLSVYVLDSSAAGVAQPAVTPRHPLAWADVALDPGYLPPTQEELWERSFVLLESYVAREGTARMPTDHREGDRSLGTWVGNQKRLHADGRLRPEWAAKLERLPGWEWYATDEFGLLLEFARRESHTDVPEDHREGDRPLGRWVAFVRSARDRVPDDWVSRLEAIPHWHW